LTQILTGRKHGQSLENLGHGFTVQLRNEAYTKQCKNYPKIHGQTKGGRAVAPCPPP